MNPKSTITIQNEQDICEAYIGGALIKDLQDQYRISYRDLDIILKKFDIPRREQGEIKRILNKGQEDDVVLGYQSGKSVRALAIEYNVDRSVIKRILMQRDVYARSSYESNYKKDIDRNAVCADYCSGMSANATAVKHGIGCGAVTRILKHADIEQRRKFVGAKSGRKSQFTEHQIKAMIDMYKDGESLSSILTKVESRTSTTQLRKLLESRGVEIRNGSNQNTRYMCNERFFSNPHTPESYYILGWLYTDGYVKQIGKQYICIELKNTERSVVEYIRDTLCPTKPIQSTSKDTSIFATHCKQIHSDLIGLGLHQKKSKTIQFPKWIHDNLATHFIRGAIEGDGHIHLGIDGRLVIGFCGASPMVKQLATYITDRYAIKLCHINNGYIDIYTATSKEGALKLCSIIYRDAVMICPRKFCKFAKAVRGYVLAGRTDKALLNECMAIIEDCEKRFAHLLT